MDSLSLLTLGDESTGGGGGGGTFAGPLHRDGLNLKTPDGRIWKYRCFTGFRAAELWAKGERQWVQDYIGQIIGFGGNTIRVFCRWANTGYSVDQDLDEFENFMLGAKAMGAYVHVVISCDQVNGSSVLIPLSDLHVSARQIAEICRRVGNAAPCECSNEDFKNGEVSASFDAAWFSGVVATRSTWYTASTQDPQTPGTWLDVATVHPGGDDEWSWEGPKILVETQKLGLGAYPAASRPALIGEPRRIAEGTNPRQWADHAFHAENFGAGACVHGGFKSLPQAHHHESDLQNCKMPTSGLALDCIKAVSDVWRSSVLIDSAAADGAYTRASVKDTYPFEQNDNECPIVHWDRFIDGDGHHYEDPRGAGRSYFMRLPDGRMVGGAVDPGSQWTLETRLGYHLVAQGGYDGDGRGGNILVLQR